MVSYLFPAAGALRATSPLLSLSGGQRGLPGAAAWGCLCSAQGERSQQSPASPHTHWRGITWTGNYIFFSPAPVKAAAFLTSFSGLTSTPLPSLNKTQKSPFWVTLQMLMQFVLFTPLFFFLEHHTKGKHGTEDGAVENEVSTPRNSPIFRKTNVLPNTLATFSPLFLCSATSVHLSTSGVHHSMKLGLQSLTIFWSGEKVDSPLQNLISTAIYCQANLHWHQ